VANVAVPLDTEVLITSVVFSQVCIHVYAFCLVKLRSRGSTSQKTAYFSSGVFLQPRR
jgi:hypothetical protein